MLDLHEGGLERLVTDLVLDARARGDGAHVVCLRRAGQLAAELQPSEVSVVPQGRLSMALPLGLARHLKWLRPDVVHLHSGVWFKAAYAARLAGIRPIVFTDHGRPHPDPLFHRILDAFGARMTDGIVAVSAALGRYLEGELGVPRAQLAVIANGIHLPLSTTPWERLAVRTELGLSADTPIIGAVGRLDSVKAYDRLLEAFSIVLNGPMVWGARPVLLLVGDGPERAVLERDADRLKLGGAVRFLGWRRDVRRLLEVFDLFVLSSDSEGTSVALLEAMAAKVAVVATRVGGTPDVLGDSGAGTLVSPGSAAELAAAIEAMLADPARRAGAGRRGHQRVLEAYSFEAMASAYRRLYGQLRAARAR